ncbi:MAG: hypothetical protein RL141_1154 [Candidatus Parcubacteria bacterium]|jgi:ComEC/Rec2-related protein
MISRIPWPTSALSAIPWMAVAFLAGVLAHAGSPFERVPVSVAAAMAVAMTGAVIFLPNIWRYGSIAILIGCIGGFVRFDLTIPAAAPEATFEGIVVSARKYDVLVRDEASGTSVKLSSTRYRVGERVRVTCGELAPLETTDQFATYDARNGAWFTCKKPEVARLAAATGWDPRRTLLEWRRTLTFRIQRILPGDAGALLSGILYGERALSAEASTLFRAAGMTHLIAVSGSNIALVVALFVPLFLALGYRRKPAIVLSGLAIMGFVIFVGAGASVVRAAVMGWLALLARVFGRKASAGRLLVVAATVIVLFDPWALAFDAGFALSFLATWGLLSWTRPLQERLTWMPEQFGLREATATTVAATFMTTPYGAWAFGTMSFTGLLTNLVAVPLVGLTMLWGAVALAFGSFAPVLALPAQGCLEAMLLVSQVARIVPWMQVSWEMPWWGLFIIYPCLFVIYIRKINQKQRYPHQDITMLEAAPFLRAVVGGGGHIEKNAAIRGDRLLR